jgi:hypothetical protein
MRLVYALPVATLSLVGCSSSSNSGAPSLTNTVWLETNANGTSGQSIDFKSDGTYEHSDLVLTSATTGNAQIEKGTYVITSPGNMALTPQQWTCTGTYAPYTATYAFSGNTLVFSPSVAATVLDFVVDTASPLATGEQITEGCFTTTGFVQQGFGPTM